MDYRVGETSTLQRMVNMKLTSNWSTGKVYWRTFNKTDTTYIIGLREGFVSNGQSITYENSSGYFQMELKRGDLFGATIVTAGHVFSNSDEYILTDAGYLQSIYDAANVQTDAEFLFSPAGGVVQFMSAGGADSTITITSSISTTMSDTHTQQTTVSTSTSDEHGTQVGGGADAKFPGPLQVGLHISESVSDKVTNKVEEVVVSTFSQSISTVTAYSETQTITLKANRLTAVVTNWQRRYVTGTITLLHDVIPFDATMGYISSRAITDYTSPSDLPSELMAAYRAQNPGYSPPLKLADGDLLREQSSAPVYVIVGGAKFYIPNTDVLQSLYGGWGHVVVVPDGSLSAVPTTPQDGTLLREASSPDVWMIRSGQRCHVVSPEVLSRYGGQTNVRLIPDGAAAGIPMGAPVTE
jgi:hypothetical protein